MLQCVIKYSNEFIDFIISAHEALSEDLLAVKCEKFKFLDKRPAHLLPKVRVELIYRFVDNLFKVILCGLLSEHL